MITTSVAIRKILFDWQGVWALAKFYNFANGAQLVLGQVSGAGDRTSLRWGLSDPGRRRQQGCSVTVGFRPFVQGRHPRHAPPTYGPGRSLLLITRCGAQFVLD